MTTKAKPKQSSTGRKLSEEQLVERVGTVEPSPEVAGFVDRFTRDFSAAFKKKIADRRAQTDQ